ncbi:MAG: hypothetical protein ACHQTE_02545 [Candidatus Saccharimonadales bacterium]
MVKQTTKKSVKKPIKKAVKKSTTVVDFEPNKMGFAVAALAAISLVLLGLVAMYT